MNTVQKILLDLPLLGDSDLAAVEQYIMALQECRRQLQEEEAE